MLKRAIHILSLLIFSCAVLSCSSYTGPEVYYEYDFVDETRGCQTGYYAYKSKKKYCKRLLREDQNNSCALEQRREEFESECEGDFVSQHADVNGIEYYYDFREARCSTGYRTFKNHFSYCRALENEKMNGGCAKEERADLHSIDCI